MLTTLNQTDDDKIVNTELIDLPVIRIFDDPDPEITLESPTNTSMKKSKDRHNSLFDVFERRLSTPEVICSYFASPLSYNLVRNKFANMSI